MPRYRLTHSGSVDSSAGAALGGSTRRCALMVFGIGACCLSLVRASIAEDRTPSAQTNAAAEELTPAVLLDELESTARQKQARMERLRQQLLQLAEQSRHAAHPLEDATTTEPPSLDPHSVPQPPDDDDVPTPDASHSEPLPPGHDGSLHGESGHAAEPGSHQESATTDVAGTRINRIALGDSLFASGQAELALQAYTSIELTRLAAADRHWIEYQIANCHRKLGDIAEAERRYRRLAEMVDGGWCAAHARWWLDALSTRTALHRELATIERTLQTIEEQLNDRTTP